MTPIGSRFSWFGICLELIVNEKWSPRPVLIRNLYNLRAIPVIIISVSSLYLGAIQNNRQLAYVLSIENQTFLIE